jgi:hypothetical protein
VFENRVLRRVFGPKKDEVTGEWIKLHNEEFSDLYSLPNILRVVKSRRMRRAGHVARMGEGSGVRRVLVGKPEGKRPLGRPRHRREDNINTLGTGYLNCLYAYKRKFASPVLNVLRWIFGKWEGVVGTGWSWLRIGTGGGRLWVR